MSADCAVMPSANSILVINPGSTSTKIAIARGNEIVEKETIVHPVSDLHRFSSIWDQFPFRLELCKEWAASRLKECSAVASLGGLLRPVQGGAYGVNRRMIEDARANFQGEHASNLGCALAHEIASVYGCPAVVVDPVSVDEFEGLAYYSGHPCIKRRSLSHALNIHAAARRASVSLNIPYEESSLIVGHLGGGISIAAVRGGRIIDVNDAASDGPFSPERTGGLPLQPLLALCFSGQYAEAEMRAMVMGRGGLAAYLGTNSVLDVEQRIKDGDATACEVYRAMAYQISKEIGAMSTVLSGSIDAIVLTGGVARSTVLTSWIEERVCFIARVLLYPGEDEMNSIAETANRVLRGEERIKEY